MRLNVRSIPFLVFPHQITDNAKICAEATGFNWHDLLACVEEVLQVRKTHAKLAQKLGQLETF